MPPKWISPLCRALRVLTRYPIRFFAAKFPIYSLDFGGCKPFWLEPGLGAPMLLPYVMGAAPAPDGDGLVVYANAPRDEAATLLAALRRQ